jgi:hypothetical protein
MDTKDHSVKRIVIGMTIVFGTIAMFLWYSAPRLLDDVLHAGDYVPAQSYRITDYKCTNWNGVLFNECTAKFLSLESGASREITDWRFGRAPQGPVRLLQRRADATAVTTDVSLQTLWNRLALALALLLLGALLAIGLAAKATKPADAPAGAPRMG